MEKIKLNNGQAFDIIPMGIESNNYKKTRKYSFISELGYSEVETAFQFESISKIEYFSAANEPLKTYTDCINLKSLAKEFNKEYEDGKFADVYTVVLGLV